MIMHMHTHTYLNIDAMANSEPVSTSTKEPRPNNPQQAKKFRKETNKALLTFVEDVHSLDQYKAEAALQILCAQIPQQFA